MTLSLLIALDWLDLHISLVLSSDADVLCLQSLCMSCQLDEDAQISCLQKSKMPTKQ